MNGRFVFRRLSGGEALDAHHGGSGGGVGVGGIVSERKSSSTSQSSVAYAYDCQSPRKLSGASVASFASSFQDYCRKLSNSSVGAGSTAGDTQANPISPTAISAVHQGGETDTSPVATVGASAAVRKFSDPNDYGQWSRSAGGGKAPLFFELDSTGGLRRLASTSLERYRPYMSR